MIQLLERIKAALEATGYFKTVYLSEMVHEEGDALPPPGAKLPAAGVHDNGEDPPQDQSAGGLLRKLHVQVVVYTSADAKGKEGLTECLQLAGQVKTALNRNLLNLSGLIQAKYDGAEGTRLDDLKGAHAVRKAMSFYYELEE